MFRLTTKLLESFCSFIISLWLVISLFPYSISHILIHIIQYRDIWHNAQGTNYDKCDKQPFWAHGRVMGGIAVSYQISSRQVSLALCRKLKMNSSTYIFCTCGTILAFVDAVRHCSRLSQYSDGQDLSAIIQRMICIFLMNAKLSLIERGGKEGLVIT